MLRPILHTAPRESETDLYRYLKVLWRRKWILLVCVTVVPLSAYVFSSRASEVFEASATIQVEPTGAEPPVDSGATVRTLAAAVRLAQTTKVAQTAAGKLDDAPADPRRLRDQVALGTDAEAGFMIVTASAPSAQGAADIANAYADAIIETRTERAQAQIDVTIAETRNTIGGVQPGSEATASLEALRVARAEQQNKTQVIEPALRPDAPVSPKPLRSAALALALALFIGIGLVFLLDLLDRYLREPEEIEGLLESRLLGVVPASALSGRRPSGQVDEAFQMLRATLTYFNVEPLKVVLITSPVSGDGKTTVATNLALAFARSGKRVTLVDADLRRPQADVRLLDLHSQDGLGAVLAGEVSLHDVLRTIDVGDGGFTLLPAGPPPPNPSELLGSKRMRELLSELSESADLVILDTPPTLVISDAIPLLGHVSGVVVVSRLGHTPRKALTQLAAVIRNARGKLLGAVVTGGAEYEGYGHGYGDTAQPNGGTTDERLRSRARAAVGPSS